MEKIKANVVYSKYSDTYLSHTFNIVDDVYKVGQLIGDLKVDSVNEMQLDCEQPNDRIYEYKFYVITLFDADGWSDDEFAEYIAVKNVNDKSYVLNSKIEYIDSIIKANDFDSKDIETAVMDSISSPIFAIDMQTAYDLSVEDVTNIVNLLKIYYKMVINTKRNDEMQFEFEKLKSKLKN